MRFLDELEGLVSSKVGAISSLLSMIKLEARLAGISIFPFIITIFMLFIVLLSTWLITMVAVGYGVMLFYNTIIALLCVLIINVLILGILSKYAIYNLNNLSFQNTRRYFSKEQESTSNEHSQTTEIANSSN